MTHTEESRIGEITLPDLLRKIQSLRRSIWQDRRLVARALGIGLLVGLTVALTAREEYSASTRLLPYRSAAATSGLSGLAGLAGIRLPAGVADQTITADLYPVIARTMDFRVSVSETPIRFERFEKPLTLVRYFEQNRSMAERAGTVVADARAALSGLLTGARPRQDSDLLGADGDELRTFSRDYLRIIRSLDSRLSVSIDKKTSVITISGLLPDPVAVADLVQTAADLLMLRIIDYEAKKAGEQLAFIEEQHRLSRTRYEQSQKALAQFADRNRMLVGAVAAIERERLQREYDIAFQLFEQFSVELEQARIKKNQDTPVFTVLEHVSVPNERTSPRRGAILLMFGFLGVAVGVGRILWTTFVVSDGAVLASDH